MPKPICIECKTSDSLLWRPVDGGQICTECFKSKEIKGKETDDKERSETKESPVKDDDLIDIKIENFESQPAPATGKGTRKSTRATRYKAKTLSSQPVNKTPVLRGRGRRSIFKRQPLKAPESTATVVTSQSIFYKGNFLQVGDIVSMIDIEGGVYYAQLRGFLTDQYCEKSAAVTWLLPTKASPPPEECFDPATYIVGPEEDLPRKLDYMEFVMHAPSDYYKASDCPYPPLETQIPLKASQGFIWTTFEPVDRT